MAYTKEQSYCLISTPKQYINTATVSLLLHNTYLLIWRATGGLFSRKTGLGLTGPGLTLPIYGGPGPGLKTPGMGPKFRPVQCSA